jgi:hypothetical protein
MQHSPDDRHAAVAAAYDFSGVGVAVEAREPTTSYRAPLGDLSGRNNPMNYLADLHMMALFPGAKERTPAEYGRLFRESGLREPQVIPTPSAFSIIETGVAS